MSTIHSGSIAAKQCDDPVSLLEVAVAVCVCSISHLSISNKRGLLMYACFCHSGYVTSSNVHKKEQVGKVLTGVAH